MICVTTVFAKNKDVGHIGQAAFRHYILHALGLGLIRSAMIANIIGVGPQISSCFTNHHSPNNNLAQCLVGLRFTVYVSTLTNTSSLLVKSDVVVVPIKIIRSPSC